MTIDCDFLTRYNNMTVLWRRQDEQKKIQDKADNENGLHPDTNNAAPRTVKNMFATFLHTTTTINVHPQHVVPIIRQHQRHKRIRLRHQLTSTEPNRLQHQPVPGITVWHIRPRPHLRRSLLLGFQDLEPTTDNQMDTFLRCQWTTPRHTFQWICQSLFLKEQEDQTDSCRHLGTNTTLTQCSAKPRRTSQESC